MSGIERLFGKWPMRRAILVVLLLTSFVCVCKAQSLAASSTGDLPRYWPRFTRPRTVLRAVRPVSREEYAALLTLAGLVARAGLNAKTTERIWVDSGADSAYTLWFNAMIRQTGATVKGPFTTDDLIRRFQKAGIVRGYVLYHPDNSTRNLHEGRPADESINVATSLCAPMEGIAVSDTVEPIFQRMGLKRLFDARGMTQAACFDRYKALFHRNLVAMQDPKVPETRDAVVAMQAFLLSEPGPLYEKALAWAEPDSPVLGWGVGDEFAITSAASRHGLFITSTDWCSNLPLLSTEAAGKTLDFARIAVPRPRTIWDLNWESNVHYVTFVMSDGDNVQWLMGDFTRSVEHSWWDSVYRGKVKMGWTTCYDNLAQLCPYTLEYLFRTATPNDDFLLFSGGYYYPDLFGSQRPGADVLTRHAADLNAYMRPGGIRLLALNLQQWDSAKGRRAYTVYARNIPDLLGMFAVSYSPYTAGRGNVIWADNGRGEETPVTSIRFAIWNHASDPGMGDPARVASLINGMPHSGDPNTESYFSTVMIHAWSWFREPHEGLPAGEVDQARGGKAGTGRGACTAKWCADRLEPYVRVLTPTEYVWMLRLRRYPRVTLRTQLAALSEKIRKRQGASASAGSRDAIRKAGLECRAAERSLQAGDFRAAFEQGKRAYNLLPKNG